MKAKLKTLDEVKEASPKIRGILGNIIYHSKNGTSLTVHFSDHSFGDIVDVEKADVYTNRVIYRDKNSEQPYYDEWFEWIGEEPPIIEPLPESLWDISDW